MARQIAKQETEITLDGRYYLVKYDAQYHRAEPGAGFMTGGWEISIESIADYGPITEENETPVAVYDVDDFNQRLRERMEDEIAWNL